VKIVEITLKSIIEGIHLGSLDHLLGFMLGFVEGLVIVCLILFLIVIQPFFDSGRILGESLFAKIFLPLITGTRKEILESVVMARRLFFDV
jgi:membrane protein required for colicin V production